MSITSPIVRYLEKINQNIQKFPIDGLPSYEEFLSVVRYDFYEKISDNTDTKKCYEDVLLYFRNLRNSEVYKSAFSELVRIATEIVDVACVEPYLSHAQAELGANNRYLNPFKNRFRGPDFLSLAEFAETCCDEQNYQNVDDASSLSSEDIASGCYNATTVRQFEVISSFLTHLVWQYKIMGGENNHALLEQIGRYQALKNQIEEALIQEPERIHFKAYRWMHEHIYEAYKPGDLTGLFFPPDPKDAEKVKKIVAIIMNDLEYKIEMTAEARPDVPLVNKPNPTPSARTIEFDLPLRKLFYQNKLLHEFHNGVPIDVLTSVFSATPPTYDYFHNMPSGTNRDLFCSKLRSFQTILKTKLRAAKAPSNFYNQTFFKVDGPKVSISSSFTLKT